MEGLELVFVVGCQRSGTTLTGQILGAHPAAILIDEQDGLYSWFDALATGGDAAKAATDTLLRRARKKYIQPGVRLHEDDGEAMRPSPGVTHIVLKAPNLTYAAERIARIAHGAHIVYPVRDPRAVVASMGRLAHIDMIGNQMRWMRGATDLADRLGPEIERLENDAALSETGRRALIWRVKSSLMDTFEGAGLQPLVFRYEDLVADLAGYCATLARHCGLSADPSMTAHETAYIGHSPDGVTPRDRKVDTGSLVQWKDDLPVEARIEIAREVGETAARFGYDLGASAERRDDTDAGPSSLAPLVLAGRGGGGTRLFSELVRSAGISLGNDINETGDSLEWVEALYGAAITTLNGGTSDPGVLRRTGRNVLDRAALRRIDEVWGWKLPESMLAMPTIISAFPEARVVHILRHPVMSSLRRTHVTSRANNPVGAAVLREAYAAINRDAAMIERDQDYLRNAISWLFQVRQVRDFGRNRLASDQYLELRYEDLCSRPGAVIARLAGFSGVSADAFTAPEIDTTRTRAFEAGDPRILEVWDLCGDVARSLGYGLSADGHPIVSGNV